jgi:hypothetical protein
MHPIAYLRFGLNPARFGYFKTELTEVLARNPDGRRGSTSAAAADSWPKSSPVWDAALPALTRLATLEQAARHAARSGLEIESRVCLVWRGVEF